MKYYIVADIHGFYSEFIQALSEKGFFNDQEPHKLIVCGDLFDRGNEALALQQFILDLMKKDEVILIRGNHEDLMLQLLNNWHVGAYYYPHFFSNGTISTVCQLTKHSETDIFVRPDEVGQALLKNDFIQKIIPTMKDYFETENYVFVHGWIPCDYSKEDQQYTMIEDWRKADDTQWYEARWINGMEAAHHGMIDTNKTIVCGHWHTSFGHSNYLQDGSEFGEDSNFNPYYNKGIIALDSCCAKTKIINCIVIED